MIDENIADEMKDPELRSMRDAWEPASPAANLRERVLRAYDREFGRGTRWWAVRAVQANRPAAAFVVAVISIGAVVGLNVVRPIVSKPDTNSRPHYVPANAGGSVISRESAPAPAAKAAGESKAGRSSGLGARSRRALPNPAQSPQIPGEEVLTDFFPLVDAPPPLVNGVLLRVTLPAAAIQLAGFPLREDQLNENVEADLLIGDDGTAQAIRFVGSR